MNQFGRNWDLTGPLGTHALDNANPNDPQKCGVNPVTGTPGISRQPYNQTGNLRNDSQGSGEWMASRGGGTRQHIAVDISGNISQPVVSFLSGTVTMAEPNNGGYGMTIEVTHSNGLKSSYHHLNSIRVAVGDTVGTGQLIGTLGQTGNANNTNPHVDFEIRQNGRVLNPVNVLNSPCPK